MPLRIRNKKCFECKKVLKILFRCKYKNLVKWVFVCEECLKIIKNSYLQTYKYGGTWKSEKLEILCVEGLHCMIFQSQN